MSKYIAIIALAAIAFVGVREYQNISGENFDIKSFFGGSSLEISYPAGTSCAELSSDFQPQASPEATYQLELDLMSADRYCYDLPIFDSLWRRRGDRVLVDEAYGDTAWKLRTGWEALTSGDFAVIYYPGKRDIGPVFLHWEKEGWIMERTAVERYIRFELSGTVWYAIEGDYIYLSLLKQALPMSYVELLDGTDGYQVI